MPFWSLHKKEGLGTHMLGMIECSQFLILKGSFYRLTVVCAERTNGGK